MKHDELLDVVVNRLIAEGVTEKNYTSFKALFALRKCVMGRKLTAYLISGNEIKVQQRLAELSQTKQINATELPYIKQQFTASEPQPEEILQKYMDMSMIICPLHVVPRTVALDAMQEHTTLHAQRIADKMVEERLREALTDWADYWNELETGHACIMKEDIDEYLKTKIR